MFIQLKPKLLIREPERSEISTRASSLNLTGRFKTGGTPASAYIRPGGCLSERSDVSTWLERLVCRKLSNVSLIHNRFLQDSTSMLVFLRMLGVHVR